jgi:hypothetical protein
MSVQLTPTSRRPNYLVAAAPLLWAVLILFHPVPSGDTTLDGLDGVVDRWLVVHVGQLILTPLLFLAVWRLLAGLTSTAATVSRCALVVWTVFFTAYDAIQGVANGLLVRYAGGLPEAEQLAVADALDYLVFDSRLAGDVSAIQMVAGAAWLTVAIAGAIALHQARAGKAVVVLTAISVLFSAHMAAAAIGLLALSAAIVLREQQRAAAPALPSPPAPSMTPIKQPPAHDLGRRHAGP